ncbi:hypothetical protein KBD59_03150 [Candidatus Gracilibacteria bacterium]|nr:hypothetical protein [Candidatus Gracilibacteria bacterium]
MAPEVKPTPEKRQDPREVIDGALAAEKQQTEKERLKSLMRMPDVNAKLFGDPDKDNETDHETQAAHDRYMNDPKYKELHRSVMVSVRNLAERQKREVKYKDETQEQIYDKTMLALNRLQTQLVTEGRSMKLRETKRARTDQGSVDGKIAKEKINPDLEVMDYEELLTFKNRIEQLERVDANEVRSMLEEDADFTLMLFEQMSRDRVVTQVGTLKDTSVEGMQKMQKDAQRMLSLENPNAVAHYKRLIGFISGDDEQNNVSKSDFRHNAERPLWIEIVRNMKQDEKKFLVERFAVEKTPAAAKEFIQGSIAAGTIRVRDVMKWTMEAQQNPESSFFQTLDKPFLDSLDTLADMRRATKEDLQKHVEDMSKTNLDSAVGHYLTFNNFLYSRLMDIGALSMLVSLITNVSDRLNRRTEHTRNEGRIKAFVMGIKDGVINRSSIFGMTSAAIGMNGISPFFTKMMYAPSVKEKELVARNHDLVELDDMFSDRPQLARFMLNNFDDMHQRATQNKEGTFPNNENEKRGDFSLWPKDVMEYATIDNTLKCGYKDHVRFGSDVFHSFRILSKVVDIHDKEKLEKYLTDNGYLL